MSSKRIDHTRNPAATPVFTGVWLGLTRQKEAGKKINPLEAAKATMSGIGRGIVNGLRLFGEIESWKVDSEMPVERIKSFVEQLIWIYNQKEISNLSLILTGFAEEGFSSDTIVKVKSDEIISGISVMSKYYFDIWTDNLVIEII